MSSELNISVDQPALAEKPLNNQFKALLAIGALAVLGLLLWQAISASGAPDPTAEHTSRPSAIFDIAVLVFREGLETILVLTAILVSLTGKKQTYQRPILTGSVLAILASLVTWFIAVKIVSDLTESFSALDIQAATGLLAVIVLLTVMNWFFHKIYWGGWITMHNRRKNALLGDIEEGGQAKKALIWGLILLGFTSVYREGFEIVIFLQSYYLKLGGEIVLLGTLVGLFFTGIVAILTFVAQRRLPYRKMLVFTGILLGVVLLVMVGEQAFEMQQANWIATTEISWLKPYLPDWAGVWFSLFPTVETLLAQLVAAILVIGSYFLASRSSKKNEEASELA
jgi:high-affinity iron transporter